MKKIRNADYSTACVLLILYNTLWVPPAVFLIVWRSLLLSLLF